MRKEVWDDDICSFWKEGATFFKFYVISQKLRLYMLFMHVFFQGGSCFDQWKLEKKTTTQRRHFDKLDKVLRCLDWWQVIPLMASRNPAG